ncbi:MAG: SusD/RagB family nutrient-binding outer membrane lipoprotein [Candidatus Marinimicrobia bacterium]|nr:SusD/RagB family nutrient-binding outer membrane lipoprotein [Candidatus Neomarinimicrobiota bacterium]
MKKIIVPLTAIALLTTGCEIDKAINDNPNEITLADVDPKLFLNGAQLANAIVQVSHINRICGMYSGQLIGFTSLYSNIYGYALSTVETNGEWNSAYIGVVTNTRHIQEAAADDKLLVGISKVVEANAIGTLALLTGDVPYSEIGGTVDDPKFDGQKEVLAALSTLLDGAISDLSAATTRKESFDIYFNGDKDKWIAAAYTLKARFALANKDYAGALAAAGSGISSSAGDMMYTPRGDASISQGDKNLFYTILEGSRTGDLGNDGSYLLTILDPSNAKYRGNTKTNETARHGYYTIDESTGSGNKGVIEQYEPQPIATYSENQLIKAEASARSGFAAGLSALNTYRAWLAGGGRLNSTFDVAENYKYDPYVEADFASGGMENADGLSKENALLREIIEERYVSGFGSYMPFNDHRRLRGAGETDLIPPFPLNTAAASQHVERIQWAEVELLSNQNAPDDPGLYAKTEVNK